MPAPSFEQECKLVCPICRLGHAARYRFETNEYVHDVPTGAHGVKHSLCVANEMRKKHNGKS